MYLHNSVYCAGLQYSSYDNIMHDGLHVPMDKKISFKILFKKRLLTSYPCYNNPLTSYIGIITIRKTIIGLEQTTTTPMVS